MVDCEYPKAPFSIGLTPRCGRKRKSILWLAPLYPIMLSVKQGGIKYHFWVFGMTRPRIEPCLPENRRTMYSLGQWPGKYFTAIYKVAEYLPTYANKIRFDDNIFHCLDQVIDHPIRSGKHFSAFFSLLNAILLHFNKCGRRFCTHFCIIIPSVGAY